MADKGNIRKISVEEENILRKSTREYCPKHNHKFILLCLHIIMAFNESKYCLHVIVEDTFYSFRKKSQ